MTIYVDVSAAAHSRAGLGRYAGTLAQALDQRYPGRIALFYNRGGDAQAPPGLAHLPQRTVRARYKPWRMAVWLGQLAGLSFRRLVPDATLYHATEHLLMPLPGCPTVLTVHDLIYRLFPQHHKRLNYWYLNAAMPLFVRRAGAIITISEATKRDVIRHYRVPADKIHVIYEAAAPGFAPSTPEAVSRARARYGLPERYLLSVGTIEPRKNLPRVLQALEQVRARGVEVGWVIVGSKGWLYEGFLAQLEGSPARAAVRLPGYVPDADLPAVYGGAEALVMASVYEGFGLPILEAMACGTPVVSSNASSLPELGGDAARYFDPCRADELAEAIAAVAQDRALRDEMSHRGLAQAARFSWATAAEQTMALYASLLAS
mgnify:CR=1 FL=1